MENQKIILGIVGKPAAGKGTIVEILRSRLKDRQVLFFRFSIALTQAMSIFLDSVGRQDCQWLVSGLREKYGQDILARAAEKKLKGENFQVAILDGVRVSSEEEMLKRLGGKLIFVDTPAKIRWERINKRNEKEDDDVSFDKFLEIDNAGPEKQIEGIGQRADFKIDNSWDLKSLDNQVNQIIKELNL